MCRAAGVTAASRCTTTSSVRKGALCLVLQLPSSAETVPRRKDSTTSASVRESTEEVTSSAKSSGASRSRARAAATLAFSPPESRQPRSPTLALSPPGTRVTP
mmetsp:Transcript_38232/g.63207  ORF Transcript_38232/g.63207 Transcript_38232/m.63207 type:complete len:103 (+) Transcript_38232:225-533(+)